MKSIAPGITPAALLTACSQTGLNDADTSSHWQIDIFGHHSDGGPDHYATRAIQFFEPLFAILNFAKINGSAMQQDWVMEVDWVKHEYRQ